MTVVSSMIPINIIQEESYKEHNAKLKKDRKNGTLVDAYTGQPLTSEHNQDHVISAKEINDDPGRVLAEQDGTKLANTDSNLVGIDPSINKSKGAKSISDFIKYKKRR